MEKKVDFLTAQQSHYAGRAAALLEEAEKNERSNPEIKAVGFAVLALLKAVNQLNETIKERFPKDPE
ncbi:MAG: hypothetical protein WC878_00710 [Candidatus Paceibacterota bacterium]|jgi:hypothetical protein